MVPSLSVTLRVTDVPEAMSTVQVYEVDSVESVNVSRAADDTSPPGKTALAISASGDTGYRDLQDVGARTARPRQGDRLCHQLTAGRRRLTTLDQCCLKISSCAVHIARGDLQGS